MNKYTIFCTLKQTMKALELGAPIITIDHSKITKQPMYIKGYEHIEDVDESCVEYLTPTAEQMIGWLEEQGVMIDITHQTDGYCLISVSSNAKQIKTKIEGSIYKKDATLAAIDAALEYLGNNKKLI